ncbi:OmpH family outer membrane protein [Candidatus Fermentibacteria bacterium]|nr:OmpH family outer membrane protein [Candidatus Fermentibacteria bacterium]
MLIRLCLAVFAAVCASSAQTVVVFDSERVFESFGSVSDARELLEAEIEALQAHADSLQAEVDAIEDDLARTLMMSPERRREREALLETKKRELEQFVAATFGPGGTIERRNEELVTPLVAAINEAVRNLSLENDYDLVLDAAGGFVVFADETLDITDLVIQELSSAGGGSAQSR